MRLAAETVPSDRPLARRLFLAAGIATAGALLFPATPTLAQAVEVRHWHGTTAVTRQPEQVVASSIAEWRSLWGRVGTPPPDIFEPGRMNAVGIFLGRRAGEGYAVNVLSTSRRRDRIVVVFEERMPAEVMMAQRAPAPPPPLPRNVAGGVGQANGLAGFAPPGPGATASLAPPPPPPSYRPVGQPTSPWAIILIPRADLPVSVEQRLFR